MNQDLSVLFSGQSIIVFLLVVSRIIGMIITAPLFSTFPIPMMVKGSFAALVGFIMYPSILQVSQFQIPTDIISMSILIFKELIVGTLIGFSANLIFIGIQIGGQLLSMQMGLAVANALDPVTKQNVPIVGQFYLFTASTIFIFLNGHQWLFSSVYSSYHSIPIGLNFEFTAEIVQKLLYFTGQLFSIAFSIIMPIFGLLFIIDIALAFISKMMPQMNIFMVGLPLKIYLGLILMSLFITTTAGYLSGMIKMLLENISAIFS
ncbi:MAG: flagellar biosynthetic protein FliR [Candidatus Gastranaerophilales bacterium]|nr:flagellar biosynthetic protein FliR [Candidatus Gastranaerophilales bacterium]